MNENKVQDSGLFKASLLSISIFLMMAQAVSPALPLMYHAFPGFQQVDIETLVTIPNTGIVVGLLLSPFLIKLIGQKSTIISGLLMTLIFGTIPMYSSAYMLILVSRLLLGFGIGLFNSLAVSLIPQFYNQNEEKLAKMIGYQNAMGSLGTALSSFLISFLVTISWHAAFAIYFLAIPSLIMFFLFVPLPKDEIVREEAEQISNEKKSGHKQTINSKVVWIAGLMFLIFIFYTPYSFKMPSLVLTEKIGTLPELSTILGIVTLVMLPVSAMFGFVFKKIHDLIFPIASSLMPIGFYIISASTNMTFLIVGILVLNVGFIMISPYMYNWLDWSAPQGSINLATTIVLVLVNAGCTISPTVINFFQSLFGTVDPRSGMLISTVFFFIFWLYSVGHYLSVHRLAGNKTTVRS